MVPFCGDYKGCGAEKFVAITNFTPAGREYQPRYWAKEEKPPHVLSPLRTIHARENARLPETPASSVPSLGPYGENPGGAAGGAEKLASHSGSKRITRRPHAILKVQTLLAQFYRIAHQIQLARRQCALLAAITAAQQRRRQNTTCQC
jgi:hypothetical protein